MDSANVGSVVVHTCRQDLDRLAVPADVKAVVILSNLDKTPLNIEFLREIVRAADYMMATEAIGVGRRH